LSVRLIPAFFFERKENLRDHFSIRCERRVRTAELKAQ
jgi:hypothetical protein